MPAPVAAGTLIKKEVIREQYPHGLQPGLPTTEIGTEETPDE